MSSPRRSYRARLAVSPLDPGAGELLRNVHHPEELLILASDELRAGSFGEADMLLLISTDAAAVSGDGLVAAAATARVGGMLVAAALTGNVAMPGAVTAAEGHGLAVIREAVDMVVMVRDTALVHELLDVLRGGREAAGHATAATR
jgi:hypothetical protein